MSQKPPTRDEMEEALAYIVAQRKKRAAEGGVTELSQKPEIVERRRPKLQPGDLMGTLIEGAFGIAEGIQKVREWNPKGNEPPPKKAG